MNQGFCLSVIVAMGAATPVAAQGTSVFVAPSGRVFTAPEEKPYPSAAWFAATDIDRDGAVSSAEFAHDFTTYFDTLDLDKDGVLSTGEVQAYADGPLRGLILSGGVQTQIGAQVPRVGESAGTDTAQEQLRVKLNQQALSRDLLGGAGRFGLITIPQPIAAMDMDFDGRITRLEMRAAASRRFRLVSPDGKPLTLESLPKTAAQRR